MTPRFLSGLYPQRSYSLKNQVAIQGHRAAPPGLPSRNGVQHRIDRVPSKGHAVMPSVLHRRERVAPGKQYGGTNDQYVDATRESSGRVSLPNTGVFYCVRLAVAGDGRPLTCEDCNLVELASFSLIDVNSREAETDACNTTLVFRGTSLPRDYRSRYPGMPVASGV